MRAESRSSRLHLNKVLFLHNRRLTNKTLLGRSHKLLEAVSTHHMTALLDRDNLLMFEWL